MYGNNNYASGKRGGDLRQNKSLCVRILELRCVKRLAALY